MNFRDSRKGKGKKSKTKTTSQEEEWFCILCMEPSSRPNEIWIQFRKMKNGVTDILTKISKRLDSSNTKTKPAFSAFGEHVAEKLRSMNSDAAKYCQKIINDAIFYAEFNNLNYTSRIKYS